MSAPPTIPREHDLTRRFPVLARLGERVRARRIPVVLQLSIAECAAAALTMVLAHHGKRVPLGEVREALGIQREGASAHAILEVARRHGLRARGARFELAELQHLPSGSILHWEFNHYVVFERLLGDTVCIIDPGLGRRRVSLAQAGNSFTGVALLFEPTDAFEARSDDRRPLARHIQSALSEGGRLSRILVTSLSLQLFSLTVPLLVGLVVDRIVPRADGHMLSVVGAGMVGIVAFNFLSSLTRSHLFLEIRARLDVKMGLGFLEHLVSLPFDFFLKRAAGDILMRLNSNASIREILTTSTLSALLDGGLVCVYFVVLLMVSPLMASLVFVIAGLQVLAFALATRRRQELSAESLHMEARQASYQVEMLNGIETLKAMGAERRAVERWTELFVDCQNVALEKGRLSAMLEATTGSLRLLAPLFVLVVGAALVLDGAFTLGTMLALNALALGVLNPLSTLVTTFEQFEVLGSYVDRLDDVFDAESEQDDAAVLRPPALTGRIRLENVSFRYGPSSPYVVDDVSVDIPQGRFVAIVGPSGSGKSTLAGLLLALHRPSAGRVLYDGRDLAGLDVRAVRSCFGVVTQRPYVFTSSIRHNISLHDDNLPFEKIVEAAMLAQIHEEVLAMPLAYDTLVTANTLSGGQQQRISIARALARSPTIVLLDEATSALDSVTEERVRDAIDGLGCTRIVIAHRMSTVAKADLILVMDRGAIVERGTHRELLARGGVYADLARRQLDPRAQPRDSA